MAPKNRGKKRVRIQSGHTARYIERLGPHRRRLNKSKEKPQAKLQRAGWPSKIGRDRTHKPTVAELVYQFLQRASNRGVMRTQKTNANKQFRRLQRRQNPRRLRPDTRDRRSLDKPEDEKAGQDYSFPYSKIPSDESKYSIEKCIYEVLSFGTVMGFLEPADKKGFVFRVSSDLDLFNKERKKLSTNSRKRVHF